MTSQQSTQGLKDGLSAPIVVGIATNEVVQKDAEQKQIESGNVKSQAIQTARTIANFQLLVKPGLKEPSLFPDANINQKIPDSIKIQQQITMELLDVYFPNQDGQFKGIVKDVIELEQ